MTKKKPIYKSDSFTFYHLSFKSKKYSFKRKNLKYIKLLISKPLCIYFQCTKKYQ